MIKEIKTHLEELERARSIKILLAVESGSRAWGFPSPDSDYDVRIVFIHTTDWYLSITDRKDTIDYFHGELLDINGWDIRKTLNLLKKSNATPFEWAQSPIVYREEPAFRENLLALAQSFFQPQHALNHYRGIAKNSFDKGLSDGKIRLKKLFYIIRPIFAINWVVQKMTLPPMDIFNLMAAVPEEEIKEKILALIHLKEDKDEAYLYTLDPLLRNYIEEQFEKVEQITLLRKKDLPNVEVLNSFFRDLLTQYG